MTRHKTFTAWIFIFLAGYLSTTSFGPLSAAHGALPYQQEGAAETAEGPPNLFTVPPRELTRGLKRVQTAMAQRDYRTAIDLLGEFLASEHEHDYLITSADDPWRFVSQLEFANRMLGEIPVEELNDYELRYGITARQLLSAGTAAGDFDAIAQVARRYFHTSAGKRATMLLGYHFLESGKPTSAARHFERIVLHPVSGPKYEPEASVLLAISWKYANRPDMADETLRNLAAKTTRKTFQFNGQTTTLFDANELPLAWLEKLIGTSSVTASGDLQNNDNWAMFRGSPDRNANSGTGFPLPDERWYVPTIEDLKLETISKSLYQDRLTNGGFLIPALHPLAVDGMVIYRSLDQLIGVDLESGRRVWAYPSESSVEDRERVRDGSSIREIQLDGDAQRNPEWFVGKRIWQDQLHGQFTSDGQALFAVDNFGVMSQVTYRRRQMQSKNSTNELICFDLTGPRKLNWRIGGPSGIDEPRLAGSFFLGAPLHLDGSLYCLVEQNELISMAVLSAESGQLQWALPLAAIDSVPSISRDAVRRLASATPSYADGVLVCPLSAGGMVGVDLATRSLRWGVQFPRFQSIRRRSANSRLFFVPQKVSSQDSTVTIADGRVIVMPAESDRILCYDLNSGRQAWPAADDKNPFGKAAGDGLFVAGVFEGSIIIVATDQVRALRLSDGTLLWETSLEDEGDPTGRGFLNGRHYFFPTSNSTIAKLDTVSGQIVDRIETDRVLGNLICYRDQIISQGFDWVTAYHQVEPVRQRVARAKVNSNESPSAEILALTAQLLAFDGNSLSAIRTAEKAWETDQLPGHRRILLGNILRHMNEDFASAKPFADKYEQALLDYRPANFSIAMFEGLYRSGNPRQAAEFLRRPELTNELANRLDKFGLVQRVEEQALQTRLDRLVQFQLRDFAAPQATDSIDQADNVLKILGPASLTSPDLLKIANRQVRYRRFIEAESLLRIVKANEQSENADQSTDNSLSLMASQLKLAFSTKQPERFGQLWRQLENAKDEVAINPWTNETEPLKQILMMARDKAEDTDPTVLASTKNTAPQQAQWNYGSAVASTTDLTKRRNRLRRQRQLRYDLSFQSKRQKLGNGGAPDLNVRIDNYTQQVIVQDGFGKLVGRAKIQTDDRNQPVSRSNYGKHSLLGNLLIVQMTERLMAIDLNRLRTGFDAVLWNKSLATSTTDNEIGLSTGFQTAAHENPWGETHYQFYRSGRRDNLIGNFACDSLNQVIYRSGIKLNAIDAASGRLIWVRNESKNSLLVGSETKVAALHPTSVRQKPGQYDAISVLDSSTGTKLNELDLGALSKQTLWHFQSSNLFFSSSSSNEQTMTHFDWETNKTNWKRTYERGTLAEYVEHQGIGKIVFVTPKGLLEYVDAETGELLFSCDLEPTRHFSMKVKSLADGRDLIQLGKQSRTRLSARSHSPYEPVFSGSLYCVDWQKQELAWSGPVTVEQLAMPSSNFNRMPVLTLHRQLLVSTRNKKMRSQLFFVDLRDGRLLTQTDLTGFQYRTLAVEGNPQDNVVSVDMGIRTVKLKLNEDEFPPSPPAILNVENTVTDSLPKSPR